MLTHHIQIYGLIIKYDNQGDTIWVKQYRHPDITSERAIYKIKDIEELDNGDIVALGTIQIPGEKKQAWLFKINEYGCIGGGDTCGQYTGTNDIEPTISPILLYPNPSHNKIHITSSDGEQIQKIELYDLSGQKVMDKSVSGQELIIVDISALSNGYYIVKLHMENGAIVDKKVVKGF